MASETMALIEYLRQMGLERDPDFLRSAVQLLTQWLIELEAGEQIGAARESGPRRA